MDLDNFLTVVSIAAIPILFAITLHEVAHGWTARYFGDRTAEAQGRLSLNPLRHIDPIGTVLVPLFLLWVGGFLFGWAKPVPVDARNLRRPKADMLWVAAAGPVANIAMGCFWALVMAVVLRVNLGIPGDWLASMAAIGVSINILLAVFNMLPIPPLDGGRVLASLVPAGPASRFLDAIEPWGLFIVLGLIATGMLAFLIGGPIEYLRDLITGLFGLPQF